MKAQQFVSLLRTLEAHLDLSFSDQKNAQLLKDLETVCASERIFLLVGTEPVNVYLSSDKPDPMEDVWETNVVRLTNEGLEMEGGDVISFDPDRDDLADLIKTLAGWGDMVPITKEAYETFSNEPLNLTDDEG